jgi:hypothetical protein
VPNITLHNTYIWTVTPLQRHKLFAAYHDVTMVHADTLGPKELAEQIAHLFNTRHVDKCMSDHIGFGGKIRIKKVEKWLKAEGNSLLIGSLGLPQTPQHDPGNVLIGHAGPACDVDRMFYPYITEYIRIR